MCKIAFKKSFCDVRLDSLCKLFSKLDTTSILGGNSCGSSQNRYSYFAAEPIEIFQLDGSDTDHFSKIQRVIDKYRLDDTVKTGLPDGVFVGGWIGYFSYDLGRYVENISESAVDDLAMPPVKMCFYDKVICYDHAEKAFYFITVQLASDSKSADEKIAYLESLLEKADSEDTTSWPQNVGGEITVADFHANMTKDDYFDSFAKIKKHIYDGDVYQINFSQRFCFDFNADAIDLYQWQHQFNASPYAAYIDSGEFKIVSASPELFMKTAGRKITTRPIKGTCKRSGDEKIDAQMAKKLFDSEKEKAELDMIIDLERNDFGRICEYGSIAVSQRRVLENYATVTHAVAQIEGIIREQMKFSDILKAMFPGGSITGAPKVSAMQIIENLEPTRRGLYTGCIGYIGIDGNVCLNIAIRTIIIKGLKAYAQAGGGIVADSDPAAEWDETLAKAAALLNGIRTVESLKNG